MVQTSNLLLQIFPASLWPPPVGSALLVPKESADPKNVLEGGLTPAKIVAKKLEYVATTREVQQERQWLGRRQLRGQCLGAVWIQPAGACSSPTMGSLRSGSGREWGRDIVVVEREWESESERKTREGETAKEKGSMSMGSLPENTPEGGCDTKRTGAGKQGEDVVSNHVCSPYSGLFYYFF